MNVSVRVRRHVSAKSAVCAVGVSVERVWCVSMRVGHWHGTELLRTVGAIAWVKL